MTDTVGSVSSPARYDEIADWYQGWIGSSLPLLAHHPELLGHVAGARVLDVACGQGRMTRYLAGRGAEVTGIDVSEAMLAKASAVDGPPVTYIHGDIAAPAEWSDGRRFDGCTCELALMDIDDLGGALAGIAALLRPGGWFAASLVHPCFPGNGQGLSSWPPDRGYDAEVRWTSPDHNPDGARVRVGSTHRKLSTYLNGLGHSGFEIEHLLEPTAPVPTFLLWRARRR